MPGVVIIVVSVQLVPGPQSTWYTIEPLGKGQLPILNTSAAVLVPVVITKSTHIAGGTEVQQLPLLVTAGEIHVESVIADVKSI